MLPFAQAVADIRARVPLALQHPHVGIVCGSGLSGLAELLHDRVEVSYADIAGFGESTVHGHKSALAFGFLGESRVPVVAQLGRFHGYEGFPLEIVTLPMRVMGLLGIKLVIVTNAAGGLNPSMDVGTIVVIQDHISLPSLTSWNPLIGPNDEQFGPRFPPMSDAYDFDLRKHAFRAAKALGFEKGTLAEGVYAWVAGPTYETRAEQRFLRAAGATVVGMSTVPEVIAARHAGVRVLVLSLCTNIVAFAPYRSAEAAVDAEESGLAPLLKREEIEAKEESAVIASHQEVLDVSAQRAENMRKLVERIVEQVLHV